MMRTLAYSVPFAPIIKTATVKWREYYDHFLRSDFCCFFIEILNKSGRWTPEILQSSLRLTTNKVVWDNGQFANWYLLELAAVTRPGGPNASQYDLLY